MIIQEHAEFVSSLTEDHERNAREIETKYQAKLRALQAQNDLRRKTELHELEERKNRQVHTLMKNHEKAFSDIKYYYNDITANNLALINTLKVLVCTHVTRHLDCVVCTKHGGKLRPIYQLQGLCTRSLQQRRIARYSTFLSIGIWA